MNAKEIYAGSLLLSESAMNLSFIRHNLIASNISNMDTPNYKAFDMIVSDEINKKIQAESAMETQRTHPDHFRGGGGQADEVNIRPLPPPEFSLRGDGNTVDIDRAMTSLAENTLLYNTAAQIIMKEFALLNTAIEGK
ncbi:MAG: flagellar basal body rod protein FlgB [Desulfococcaceae bacterium]|jgi:flagellar basal-body rod protein FlgB|nr:flagellar basal body rod protein FlgB [Desulfococcaceae bacterium]